MKIASSSVVMDSSHTAQQRWERQESLRAWVTNQRQESTAQTRATVQPGASDVSISSSGSAAAQPSGASGTQEELDAANSDPMLRLIRAMISLLTGEDVKVFDASDLSAESPAVAATSGDANPPPPLPEAAQRTAQPPSRAGFAAEYELRESYTETERTRFAASGVVRTADGQEINFSIALDMTRSYREESSTRIRFGDARRTQDPLVLNFGGTAAQLTSQRFKFDLNADGKSENINFATQGSGFLALDRNGDGKINDGSELFGTQSGNGFADLALLDADHNGWIDENDPAYTQLRIWTKDAAGDDQLKTLKQADVGALSLAQTETPFSLKNTDNDLLGQIRASGLFLRESGQVGTIQQVDLTV